MNDDPYQPQTSREKRQYKIKNQSSCTAFPFLLLIYLSYPSINSSHHLHFSLSVQARLGQLGDGGIHYLAELLPRLEDNGHFRRLIGHPPHTGVPADAPRRGRGSKIP